MQKVKNKLEEVVDSEMEWGEPQSRKGKIYVEGEETAEGPAGQNLVVLYKVETVAKEAM